jgi:hypothetical protein
MGQRLLFHHLGDYFRELSVLVTVFVPLDLLFGPRRDAQGSAGALLLAGAGVSVLTFLIGHRCESWAEKD